MRFKSVFALALLVALHASAFAAESTERLVLGDFPGFAAWTKVTDKSFDGDWILEYLPSEQSVPDYKDMWVVQGFRTLKGKDPGKFLSDMFTNAVQSCESVRVNGPKKSEDEGLEVAYGQLYCGRQAGQNFGVNLHVKVVSGKDALYVVQREFRVPPSVVGGVQSFSTDQMTAMAALIKGQGEANQFLSNSVYVCASNSALERCKPDPAAEVQMPDNKAAEPSR